MSALALKDCRVELIGRVEATAMILKFEALGTMGNARVFFGLRCPAGTLLSVVGFGLGPPRRAR